MNKNILEKIIKVQEIAFSHIKDSFNRGINPICALYMGSGKTKVACEIIKDIISKNTKYRILIIIRATNLEDPWINELLIINIKIVLF